MAIPDYQSLMLPVLMASVAGEIRIGELIGQLAVQLGLSDEERVELLSSGKQTIFGNRVHWAKMYLSKAGLLESTRRGYFKITPRGLDISRSRPSRIDNAFLSQFEEFEKFRRRSGDESDANLDSGTIIIENRPETPDEIMRSAHRQIEVSLAQELLERIRNAPSEFFERLIVNLLLKMGYGGSVAEAGRALGRSGLA